MRPTKMIAHKYILNKESQIFLKHKTHVVYVYWLTMEQPFMSLCVTYTSQFNYLILSLVVAFFDSTVMFYIHLGDRCKVSN